MAAPSSEEAQKFREELHWCITQLELGLQNLAPDSRQAAEAMKVIKILRSSKAPMVKKRQAMRNALGDYRKKMKDAEKRSVAGLRNSRFQPAGKAHNKSRFLKQSTKMQHQHEQDNEESSLHIGFNSLDLSQTPGDDSSINILNQVGNPSQIFNSGDASSANPSTSSHLGITDSPSQSISASSLPLDSDQPTHPASNPQTVKLSQSQSRIPTAFTSAGNQDLNFKFVPSDNSFLFSFDNPDPTAGQGTDNVDGEMFKTVKTDGKVSDTSVLNNSERSARMGGSQTAVNQPASEVNYFKFEKSNNDFAFNFDETS